MSSSRLHKRPLHVADDTDTDRPRRLASKPGEKDNCVIVNNVSDDKKYSENVDENSNSHEGIKKQEAYKPQYIWLNIITIWAIHLVGLYAVFNSLYLMMPATYLWGK